MRIGAHDRERKGKHPNAKEDESTLFFDEQRVPVEVIQVPNPDIEGLSPEAYEVIRARRSAIVSPSALAAMSF